MPFNIEQLIPAIAGGIATISVVWINNRVQLSKARAETVVASSQAADSSAKAQYDIWQTKWEKLTAGLEARIDGLQKDNDELRGMLGDCNERLNAAGYSRGSEETKGDITASRSPKP